MFVIANQKITWNSQCHKLISDKVYKFANAMSQKGQSNQYYQTERNAANPHENQISGKFGEFAATIWLRQQGFKVPLPDLSVHPRNKKNWDCDLPSNLRFHVKTCTAFTSRYAGLSWTFQFAPSKDKLFTSGNESDIIVLVFLEKIGDQGATVVAAAPWSALILKDPKNPKLYGQKKCFYFEDLQQCYQNYKQLSSGYSSSLS